MPEWINYCTCGTGEGSSHRNRGSGGGGGGLDWRGRLRVKALWATATLATYQVWGVRVLVEQGGKVTLSWLPSSQLVWRLRDHQLCWARAGAALSPAIQGGKGIQMAIWFKLAVARKEARQIMHSFLPWLWTCCGSNSPIAAVFTEPSIGLKVLFQV